MRPQQLQAIIFYAGPTCRGSTPRAVTHKPAGQPDGAHLQCCSAPAVPSKADPQLPDASQSASAPPAATPGPVLQAWGCAGACFGWMLRLLAAHLMWWPVLQLLLLLLLLLMLWASLARQDLLTHQGAGWWKGRAGWGCRGLLQRCCHQSRHLCCARPRCAAVQRLHGPHAPAGRAWTAPALPHCLWLMCGHRPADFTRGAAAASRLSRSRSCTGILPCWTLSEGPWTQLPAHWLHASRSQDTAAPMSAASQAHLATDGEGPFTGPFSVAPRSLSTAPVPKHRGPVWGPKVHQSADEALQHVEGGQSYSARTYL